MKLWAHKSRFAEKEKAPPLTALTSVQWRIEGSVEVCAVIVAAAGDEDNKYGNYDGGRDDDDDDNDDYRTDYSGPPEPATKSIEYPNALCFQLPDEPLLLIQLLLLHLLLVLLLLLHLLLLPFPSEPTWAATTSCEYDAVSDDYDEYDRVQCRWWWYFNMLYNLIRSHVYSAEDVSAAAASTACIIGMRH